MLTTPITPFFDVAGGRVVKGVRFLDLRDAGDPVELAALYEAEGADELVFLDIKASPEGRDTALEMVRRIADQVFIPFTVGGGIRTTEDVRLMLESGADKVAINTAAGMDADGTQEGYDIALTRAVSEAVPVPVIASGGAGGPEHLHEAIVEGKADAVLAASIFHFGTYRIREVKEYLAERGVPVRL